MFLLQLRRQLAALFFKVDLATICGGMLLYAFLCYVLLMAAGEQQLLKPENFVYWLVVTASTVGYGDLSATTAAGKLVTILWVIPVGLSLFAIVLGRIGFIVSDMVLKGKKGFRMIHSKQHCVIIGWNKTRTLRLIELLLSKSNGRIGRLVLCVDVDIENPMPGKIDFVRVDSFSNAGGMQRTNIASASLIVIDTPFDDVTLTTALFCNKVSPKSHKTAYFLDESVGELLRSHCPNIEVIPSVSVEMLARSSLDPGSARLHKQLLDSTYGMTQYSVVYPGSRPLKFDEVFKHFKFTLGATLLGVRQPDHLMIDLNPSLQTDIKTGDYLYYIAKSRLSDDQCFNS